MLMLRKVPFHDFGVQSVNLGVREWCFERSIELKHIDASVLADVPSDESHELILLEDHVRQAEIPKTRPSQRSKRFRKLPNHRYKSH